MNDATPEYSRELVGFLAGLQPQDLPAEVADRARYFLLDYLAVALRGSREPSAAAVRRMVERQGAPGCATVIGAGLRTMPALAALANGASAHGIEMDDTHSGGSLHLGAVMYSAALALAEANPETPPDQFFTAVVAGYEAAARIAMAVQPSEHYRLGFHPTATCGAFGAAVTAAKLLGLTPEPMRAALGIAGSMAAGSMEFLAEGAWTKRLHPGLAAQNGIQAALLAAEGFTGPARILEGRDGFLAGHSRSPIPERLTADLGRSFEILHTAVKPHACCRYMQGPIDAILELARRHDLQPDSVRAIEVAVLEAGWGIVAEPRAQKYHPENTVDAQFSMPFGAAVAVLHRAAGLGQFTLDNIRSPRVRNLMAKVVLVKDRRLEENFPREWPARISIELMDGRQYEQSVRYPKGDPQNPLSWDEMAAKFRSLAGAVLSPERCSQIIALVSQANPATLPALCAETASIPAGR
ncbi:MAG: MmgE/PrpD family protein [Acidobacteriia bacterium]|nr:MmgE/PrpD family protein [Terriglobia bacterium]